MIKQMIRIIILPVQSIFDAIRHQRRQRLMMSYALKINPKNHCCALMKEINMKSTQGEKINLARTAMNGA